MPAGWVVLLFCIFVSGEAAALTQSQLQSNFVANGCEVVVNPNAADTVHTEWSLGYSFMGAWNHAMQLALSSPSCSTSITIYLSPPTSSAETLARGAWRFNPYSSLDLDSFPAGFSLTLDGGAAAHSATITTGGLRSLLDVSVGRALTLRGLSLSLCAQQYVSLVDGTTATNTHSHSSSYLPPSSRTRQQGDPGRCVTVRDGGTLIVESSSFSDNTVGGEYFGRDGAAIAAEAGSTLQLSHSNFTNNVAFGCGGAVAAAGTSSTVTIEGCFFEGNACPGTLDTTYLKYQGGGAVCVRGDLEINASTFAGNRAGCDGVTASAGCTLGTERAGYGGAVLLYSSESTRDNALKAITASSQQQDSGSLSSSTTTTTTSAPTTTSSTLRLEYSWLESNTAQTLGGGVFMTGGASFFVSNTTLMGNLDALGVGLVSVSGSEIEFQCPLGQYAPMTSTLAADLPEAGCPHLCAPGHYVRFERARRELL